MYTSSCGVPKAQFWVPLFKSCTLPLCVVSSLISSLSCTTFTHTTLNSFSPFNHPTSTQALLAYKMLFGRTFPGWVPSSNSQLNPKPTWQLGEMVQNRRAKFGCIYCIFVNCKTFIIQKYINFTLCDINVLLYHTVHIVGLLGNEYRAVKLCGWEFNVGMVYSICG